MQSVNLRTATAAHAAAGANHKAIRPLTARVNTVPLTTAAVARVRFEKNDSAAPMQLPSISSSTWRMIS